MKTIKIRRKCDKCDGWGCERLAGSADFVSGMVIDCSRCKGTGKITEEIEVLE